MIMTVITRAVQQKTYSATRNICATWHIYMKEIRDTNRGEKAKHKMPTLNQDVQAIQVLCLATLLPVSQNVYARAT